VLYISRYIYLLKNKNLHYLKTGQFVTIVKKNILRKLLQQ